MLQFSSGDITVVQLKINLSEGDYTDVLIGSIYMPYDSKDLPLLEVKKLVTYEGRELELLLSCDTNSHHVESAFMGCRRQEVIDIVICSRRLVGDWKVSRDPLGRTTNRYTLPSMW